MSRSAKNQPCLHMSLTHSSACSSLHDTTNLPSGQLTRQHCGGLAKACTLTSLLPLHQRPQTPAGTIHLHTFTQQAQLAKQGLSTFYSSTPASYPASVS